MFLDAGATQYDPGVIQEYASRLYKKARWIAIRYAFWTGLLFFLATLGLTNALRPGEDPMPNLLVTMIVASSAALLGGVVGYEKSFRLRLDAQIALCQVRIEYNTRRLSV